MSFALSFMLSNMAESFGKYRVRGGKMKLHYNPLVPTSSTQSFTLAVSADGAHPVIGVVGTTQLEYPSYISLQQGPQSISFPAWLPWSAEYDVDDSEKYTYCVPIFSTSNVVYPEPDTRSTAFGSLACFAGTSNVGTYGELYWEADFELWDPFPLGVPVRPYYLASMERQLGVPIEYKSDTTPLPPTPLVESKGPPPGPIKEKDGRAVVDLDDDDYLHPSPPPFRPAPPGSALPPPRTPSVKKS
jgi:hypothetical protein